MLIDFSLIRVDNSRATRCFRVGRIHFSGIRTMPQWRVIRLSDVSCYTIGEKDALHYAVSGMHFFSGNKFFSVGELHFFHERATFLPVSELSKMFVLLFLLNILDKYSKVSTTFTRIRLFIET